MQNFTKLISMLGKDNFPYDDYQIVGSIADIDYILHSFGYINISEDDVKQVLSKTTKNYVAEGTSDMEGGIIAATKDVLSKLPLETCSFSKILFYIIECNVSARPGVSELNEWQEYVRPIIPDFIWGICHEEALRDEFRVIVVASSKS